jgi:anti-anti-sigma factor
MPSTRTLRYFSAAERDGTGVVTATARNLGVPDIEVFGEQLVGLADERGWSRVEVDLRNVAHLGAGALGLFVALSKRLRARGGGLTIGGVNGPLFDVFKVTHLEQLFDILPRKEPQQVSPSKVCCWPGLNR